MPDNSIQPNTTLPKTPAGSYKIYTAILNQSGTSAPVATVLKNNLDSQSGDIVWLRSSTGVFTANATGAFTEGKTFVIFRSQKEANMWYMTAAVVLTSVDQITIWNQYIDPPNTESGTVDGMINAIVEIRVYS